MSDGDTICPAPLSTTSTLTCEASQAVLTTDRAIPMRTPSNMFTATIDTAVTTRISASPRCPRHSVAICRNGISFQPAWTRMPASAGSGMRASADGSSAANSSSQTPCSTREALVFAPAATFAELRTITAVIGSAPSTPHTALPAPCAISSLSYSVRGPSCSRSTAAALNSDSADAISVKARTVPSSAGLASSPNASRPGGWTESSRPFTSTVATGRLSARVATVARATAASAPGTDWACLGSFFQPTITAMVPTPTASETSASVLPNASTAAPGSPRILSTPEAGASSPAAAYSCPAMMTRPIPASMPSTTEREIARK